MKENCEKRESKLLFRCNKKNKKKTKQLIVFIILENTYNYHT